MRIRRDNLAKDASYNNPNGEMTIEEMIKIKHDKKVEEFMRDFRTIKNKCPNKKLIPKKIACFKCVECLSGAFSKIRELKRGYKVGKKEYPKEEFNDKCN